MALPARGPRIQQSGGGASLPVTSALLKGDGSGGASAATAGTDYPGLASANTFAANQTLAAGKTLKVLTGSGGSNDYASIGPFGNVKGESNAVGLRWHLVTINGTDGLWLAANAGVFFNSHNNLNSGALDSGVIRAAAGWVKPNNGTTTGAGGFELPQIADGGTPSSNSARIYAKDNGGTAEIYVKDEAGNETQISPHAANAPFAVDPSDPFPHVIHERNAYVGVERFIDISRMAYLLQAIFPNERVVVERDLPKSEWLDWNTVQAEHQARYDAERAAEIEAREKDVRQAAKARRAGIILDHMRAEAKAAGVEQAEIEKIELAPEIIANLEPLAADLEAARAAIPNRVRPRADIRKPAPAWLKPRMADNYDNTQKPKPNWKQRLFAWLMS